MLKAALHSSPGELDRPFFNQIRLPVRGGKDVEREILYRVRLTREPRNGREDGLSMGGDNLPEFGGIHVVNTFRPKLEHTRKLPAGIKGAEPVFTILYRTGVIGLRPGGFQP